MAYRNAGRNAGRGRQPYRNSFRGGRRSFYTLDPVQDLPKGDLIKEIALGQIEPGEKPTDSTIMIGDVGTVASYNWLDAEKPTILVPGGPAVWNPPKECHDLKEDSGEYFRDPNAARYPHFPIEPAIRALLSISSDFDTAAVNVVGCGSTIGNLLRFASSQERSFRFYAQAIGNTFFMIRKERSPKELIEDVRGYGHTFPETYTSWEAAVKGSVSHQRLMQYSIGSLNCLVRAEADGYLRTEASQDIEKDSDGSKSSDSASKIDVTSILEGTGSVTVSEKAKDEDVSLTIKTGGRKIPQDAIFDLKTRSSRRGEISMEEIYPRLCISRIPNFIVAYHAPGKGEFDDIRIQNQQAPVNEWLQSNKELFSRLEATLIALKDTAKQQRGHVVEVRRIGTGLLQLRKPLEKSWQALPADLKATWLKKSLSDSEEADGDESEDDEYLKF